MAEVVYMPKLSDTMTEGVVAAWTKNVGDAVKSGEVLAEIETDKATMEFESFYDGVLLHIGVETGKAAPVNSVLAIIGSAGEDISAILANAAAGAPSASTEAETPAPAPAAPAPTAPPVAASAPNPAPVAAPAPNPVVASAPAPAAAPAPRAVTPQSDREQVVPLSKIRRLTGAHMVMSLATSPHSFTVVEVDYANVDKTRSSIKESWKTSEGFSLTYLPFISRAVVDALVEFPHLNASIEGDNLIVHSYVDLGIAVDLDYAGLLVPVVRSADAKRLRAIARDIHDLATRARGRKLSPDEINGGTFTLSNNGSAGALIAMPIINQPQVAILSTDAIVRKPVVVAMPDGSESIAIHPMGHLSMSWDHRAFDGAYAGRFLSRVKHILETQDWSAEL